MQGMPLARRPQKRHKLLDSSQAKARKALAPELAPQYWRRIAQRQQRHALAPRVTLRVAPKEPPGLLHRRPGVRKARQSHCFP
jgi:hypothetical protein